MKLVAELNATVVVRADFQSAGRGTRGRQWIGNANSNLYLSIGLFKAKWSDYYTDYQYAACLALYSTLKHHIDTSQLQLKYPNDVLIAEVKHDVSSQGNTQAKLYKKLAGILIETEFRAQELMSCVCGIGVNLNQDSFDEELQGSATSLSLCLHKKVNIDEFEQELCGHFFELLQQSPDKIYELWVRELRLDSYLFLNTKTNVTYKVHSVNRNGVLSLVSMTDQHIVTIDSLRDYECQSIC